MNWRFQLTKAKHEIRETLHIASNVLQINIWRIAIIVLISLVILRKDVNLQLNLKSPMQLEETVLNEKAIKVEPELTNQETSTKTSLKDVMDIVLPNKKMKSGVMLKKQSVAASKFSNLGFILNPTYAKRNNISPQIVAEKARICDAYIKRFAPVAIGEMKAYGIPGSITLAQGLLESNVGESLLAVQNKNHFGIKCFSKNCKKGHCSNYTDDSHKDFFRKYDSDWASYRAHSLFLQRNRYRHLLKLPQTDYKSWAKGLSKAGYATDKQYAEKLIRIINTLKLHRFDKQ
jgi:flagellum-specific peptidoglycan hydrolase FlgJ